MMPLGLIFAILLPRLALALLAFHDPQRFFLPDSSEYWKLAGNLWTHAAFSQSAAPPWVPEVFRVPGYPFFIGFWTAMLGWRIESYVLLQCLLGAATFFLVWRGLSRLTSARRAAFATAALAFDPLIYFHTPYILSETLFLFLLVSAIFSFWNGLNDSRALRWTGRGALWGLTILVRPIAIYFPFFLALACVRPKKVVWAFLVGAYLFPFLWCLRNWEVQGSFAFSSQAGIDLMKYSASAVESFRTHRPLQEAQDALRDAVDAAHGSYATPLDRSRVYEKEALRVIAAHPVLFSRFCLYGALRVLFGTGFDMALKTFGLSPDYLGYQPEITGRGTFDLLRKEPWLIPIQILYTLALLLLYVCFGAGVRKLAASGRTVEGRFLLAGVFYFLLLSSLQGESRLRIPLMPFLAGGAVFSSEWTPSRTRRSRPAPSR